MSVYLQFQFQYYQVFVTTCSLQDDCVFQTTTNHPYQSAPPAPTQMNLGQVQNLSQVVAPTPNPMGFMPISSSGGVQRPMQPPSPPQAQPVQPAAAPAAPPPTVQTADTSKVPGNSYTYLFICIWEFYVE